MLFRSSSASTSGLTVAASKSSYKSGEPIVLQVKLTNTAKASCRVAGIPDGVLTVASAARDGSALTPTLSGGDYVNGFTAVIAANTVVVEPGKSVTVALEANTARQGVLPSLTLGSGDRSVDALYAVDQPGKYEVSVSYRMPPIELPAPPACAIGADAVSVSFTVAGS